MVPVLRVTTAAQATVVQTREAIMAAAQAMAAGVQDLQWAPVAVMNHKAIMAAVLTVMAQQAVTVADLIMAQVPVQWAVVPAMAAV